MMAQFVAIMAGLILVAESQASDLADRSTHQGFLSKSDYDKFITPNLNRMKHGNELGASPFTVVDDKPILQSSTQVQNSSDPISLSIFGIGLVSFVTMLGLTLWRALQPATIPTNTVSALGGQVMEMKAQDSNVKANSGRVGWGQQSSPNSQASTLCYAAENSEAFPFLKRPEKLDGSMVGDVGFDPLNLSDVQVDLTYSRGAEVKHGRIAMLACVGFVVQEYVHLPGADYANPKPLLAPWTVPWGANLQILLLAGALEIATYDRTYGETPWDLGFDPLRFQEGKSKAEMDRLMLGELTNGRLAMLAFVGMVVQTLLFDKPLLDMRMDYSAVTPLESMRMTYYGKVAEVVTAAADAPAPAADAATKVADAVAKVADAVAK